MELTNAFLIQTLNTVKNNIAVVNAEFCIVYTNQAWDTFGIENGVDVNFSWTGENYFKPCQESALDGDEFGLAAVKGIEMLQQGIISDFQLEYPCHSATEDRWFIMEIDKFTLDAQTFFVISHQNITHRVKLEQEAIKLSKIDGLTGIANRRAFDDFIELEWYQCMRNQFPISMLLLDVDNFKSINDEFGHEVGDACLKAISTILNQYTSRATDMCGRFGGDEFVIVWGQLPYQRAMKLANKIIKKATETVIIDEHTNKECRFFVSIGVCSTTPLDENLKGFVIATDKLMYKAKCTGKNKIIGSLLNSVETAEVRVI